MYSALWPSWLGTFENISHIHIHGDNELLSGYNYTTSLLTRHAKVASLIIDRYTASAATSLESLVDASISYLQPHLTSISTFLHNTLPRPIVESIARFLSTAESTALITVLIPPLLLLLFMSGWGRRFWPSGRYSPFADPGPGPPTVTDDDYHYLGPDDIVDPPGRRNDSYGFPHTHHPSSTDPLAPDILILKHRGNTYPLHFPAFAIAEGQLSVHELRRLAAKETKCEDPRRIKLLYKGRVLKDDTRACKDEGLKQNSELMCVVSEGPVISGSRSEMESSESASEADERGVENGGPIVEVDGTIRQEPRKRKGHRGGRRRKGRGDDSGTNTPQPRDSGFLAPSSADPGPRARSRSPSRPVPTQNLPSQPAQASRPQSAAATQLDQLERLFHSEFVPKCVSFTSHPPSDRKTRDFEYKKLSETILAQIILKLDAVETAGDESLRARRKELVRETQKVLSGLDTIGKGHTL